MLNQVCTSLGKRWDQWNQWLEIGTAKVVREGANLFPDPQAIKETYFTQAKIVTHGLGMTLLLQATFGNPLLTPWAARALGSLSVLSTSKPLWNYLKSHGKKISELPLQSRIGCAVFPFLFLLGATLRNRGIYVAEMSIEKGKCLFLDCWLGFWDLCCSVVFHSFLMHKHTVSQEKPFEEKAEEECEHLLEKTRILEQNIRKFDVFVESNPELREVCERFLKLEQYPPLLPCEEQSWDHLDPNNIIQRMTLLGIKQIRLEGYLRERLLFIQRHKEVFECFKKYVMQRPSRENRFLAWCKSEIERIRVV